MVRNALLTRLQQSTAASCTIDRLHLDVFRGRFQIEKLELRASAAAPKPFGLVVDEIRGSFGMPLLLGLKRPRLKELVLVRPRLVLETGSDAAPWEPEGFIKALNQSLELEVGKVEIRDGWLEMNNQRIALQFLLRDLTCEVRYDPAIRGYRVRLNYRQSRFQWAGREIIYDLGVRANVTAQGIDFETAEFRRSRCVVSADGSMRNWKSPTFLFRVSGSLSEEELGLFDASLREARGKVDVRADLGWSSAGFHCLGKFFAPATTFRTAEFRQAQGAFEIKDARLVLRDVTAALGRGRIGADGEFQLRTSKHGPHRMKISVQEIIMKDVAGILGLSMIDFENAVDSTVQLAWSQGARDLNIGGNVRIHAMPEGAASQGRWTELQGVSEFRYSSGIWHLSATSLSSARTLIHAESIDQSTFHAKVNTDRIAEILAIIRPFAPAVARRIDSDPDLMDISGNFQADINIRTDLDSRTTYEGPIKISNGKWRKYSLDGLRADGFYNGETLDLRSLSVAKGEQKATGDLSLDFSDPQSSQPGISFRGTVQRVDLASLRSYGVDFNADLTGALSGTGSITNVSGPWNGGGEFLAERGSINGETFDRMQARVRTENQTLHIAECQISLGKARVDVRGQVQLELNELGLAVRLTGFDLKDLAAIRDRKIEIEGRISAQGSMQGTFEKPTFKGTIGLEGLRYASWDLGGGQGTIALGNRILHSAADVRSDFGRFKVLVDISVESGYPGQAQIELQDWNVQKLIADSIPSYLSEVSTALQGRVEIGGRFAEPSSLQYTGALDGARLKLHAYELRNAEKVRFTIRNQRLHVDEARVVGEGTSLILSGDLPLDNSPTLDLRLSGPISFKILEQMSKNIRPAGAAVLNVRASGAIREPQISGQAALENVRLEHADLPFRLSSVQGNISFSRNLVRFDNLQGAVASGNVQIMGAVEHDGARLSGINLQVSLRRARVPYPRDFRSTVDADLALRGTAESQMLSGEVKIIRSEYSREFNLIEQFASRAQGETGPLTVDPLWAGLRFNVAINSDEGLQIDNELASLRAGMRLTLRGTPAYPSLQGRVETKEGSIFFRGNRFEIVRGVADFADRSRINPSLDVRAEADVRSYRLILDVKGELDHLNVNMTSDPPLTTVDIVSLLTTGRSYEGEPASSRRQSEITGLSAASILSESLTGVLGKRMRRLFGVESFRVDPFLAGQGNDPTARITINERISKDLSITFSRNLSTNEEQIVLVEYDVNKSFSIIATRDEDGKFGLDFRFRKRFR